MAKNDNRGIIEKDFKQLLTMLDFKTDNGVIYRHDNGISVNFDKKEIDYGQIKGGEDGNLRNFLQKETMVVVECVCSLITQGYSAQSIILNPRWQVGHGASGGIADIQIVDKNGDSYLIIECKTFGAEFDKYWKKTLLDGDQIFSYYQQDKKTKFSALYTSTIEDNILIRRYHLLSFIDNEELLKSLGKDVKGYKDAQSKEDTFKVWKDVYNQEYEERGIFENNQPYDVGKCVSKINDLEEITSSSMNETDKKFKNILRQHNIGSHENAFDKLVNLFLAKIVDEANNPNNLQFNWKGTAKDDIKSLTDRLQKLYKIGMKKFLNEEITYVDKKDIDTAFRFFNDDINATKSTVLDIFDKLKYYTNNDFAFLDVHNENLFKQNAQVLLKIVQMLQNFRLKTDKHNQFLGDLFEGFLDNGVKQSEGQYFTPLPIVRFITSSLPLEKKLKETSEPLKMIDYACGAGHFLNEYANQISEYISSDMKKQYFQNIYGIEKEYRLSKVSKISAFMYNQDDINIIYDDALKHDRVKDNDFDVLIANPPYAVSGFLETLSDEERKKYELTDCIKKSIASNNDIETFFIERAKQLLKKDGIAGIILPNSILDTRNNLLIKTREILLKYFDIISICKFPSKTFGKTGTKTIVLFLRRKKFPPEECDFTQERINSWFNGNYENDSIYLDDGVIEQFCNFRGIDYDDFISNPLKYETEKEKIYFYYLASLQKNPVVILDVDNLGVEDAKNFLGYGWTERNKNHHIEYLHIKKNQKRKNEDTDNENDGNIITSEEGINRIRTPLFNPSNFNDTTKINSIIKANYNSEEFEVPEELADYVSVKNLVDLLDFDSSEFRKIISTNGYHKIRIESSKYAIDKLINKEELSIQKGISITKDETEEGNIPVVAGGVSYAYYHNQQNRSGNVLTISASGQNAGYINYWETPIWASDCTTIQSTNEKNVLTKYVYECLKSRQNEMYMLQKGAAQPHVYPDDIQKIEIPFPSIDIQQKIVDEIAIIDKKEKLNKENISKYNLDIEELYSSLYHKSNELIRLSDNDTFDLTIGRRVLNCELDKDGKYPVYSANVSEPFGYINTLLIKDFKQKSVLWGIDGDWKVDIVNQNNPFYPTDHCGVLRLKNNSKLLEEYVAYALYKEGLDYGFSRSTRASIDRIEAIKIPVPDSIKEQKSVIEKVLLLKKKISILQKENANFEASKIEVLEKYLK